MLTFDLRISVNKISAASIKRELTIVLPSVKSSYLSEAIARGLGFKTHASLISAICAEGNALCSVSCSAFSAFLQERGHISHERFFAIATARVAIRNVMEAEPRLSHAGYGAGRPKRKLDGKWESSKEHYERFLQERDQLLSNYAVEEFLRSLSFVQLINSIKTINRRSGSYGLKHRAEKLDCSYSCGTRLGPHYVANGSLIVAAVHAGFKYKTFVDELGYPSINVAFNMSQISLDDIRYRYLNTKGWTKERELRAERRVIRDGSSFSDHQSTSII